MDYTIGETPQGKIKVKKELTPARRWSFLVGSHESSHTAQDQLVSILRSDRPPLLSELENAFNIETVTKEFFNKYRELFHDVEDALAQLVSENSAIKHDFDDNGVTTVDFSKKLLGQIVFLYFLQKKGWFGVGRDLPWGTGHRDFLRRLFDKNVADYSNFFNDILEPLFYNTLALERTDDFADRFNCKIPFLNGGLFDPIGGYDWVHVDILLPDSLFSNNIKTKEGDTGTGILDVFDRYNFTVKEDEPLEKEVAIDPEMLGKVFENLLEVKDRKSKGTYYTPREIVHYMCQESLINYLDTALNHAGVPLVREHPPQGRLIGETPPEQGALKLPGQREIVKREEIEDFVRHGETAVENDAQVVRKGKEIGRYTYRIPVGVRNYAELIDGKLDEIRICDPAVGSGAFLVGMMTEIVRLRNILSTYIADKTGRSPYQFKRHAIQSCLYGVDIDQGAVEIAKLRLWLSLIVDEDDISQIQPLPNLDYKIVCGNSLLRCEQDILYWPLYEELEKLKISYFDEVSRNKKKRLRDEIDALLAKIDNSHQFNFTVNFSEVFPRKESERRGFDVLIANPPYIKEDVNRIAFDGLRISDCYQGKMDIWYLFGSKCIDILRNNGTMAFIATNNWITNDGASLFRNKVLKYGQILKFIDFGDHKVFTAGIQTMVIILAKRNEPQEYLLSYGKLFDTNANTELLTQFLNSDCDFKNSKYEKYELHFKRGDYVDSYIRFIHPTIDVILQKIKAIGTFRFLDNEIFSGIDVMQDFVSKAHLEKLDGNFHVRDGIFVLSDEEKATVNWNKYEMSLLKPYYTTKEINRYSADSCNRYWVIYTGAYINKEIDKYPNIRMHLDKYQNIITSGNRPYGLHRTRNEAVFLGSKILCTRKCARPTFSFVSFPCYVSRAFLIIKNNRIDLKYLLAILNSKIIAFWLFNKGKLQGAQFQIDITPLMNIPIIMANATDQGYMINCVNKILAITHESKYYQDPFKLRQVNKYQDEIDQLVYELYGLTSAEIAIIETGCKE